MQKLELFSKLPENFFSILASPNKTLYSECIYILYQQFQRSWSFGVPKELALDYLGDYFDSLELKPDFEEENLGSNRDKAGFIIRKLKECGWIDSETDNSYNETIIIADYGIQMIELLIQIRNDKKLEYQSKVYLIHLALFSQDAMEINQLIRQVHEDTMALITSLKSLNANIRKYISRSTKENSPEDILKQFFGQYALEILDKAYHRLKTSDNVSRFRPQILQRLEEISIDRKLLEEACQLELKNKYAATLHEARDNIWKLLSKTIEAFRHMDEIVEDIDRRNTLYIRAAYNRVKYLLNTQSNIEGNINEILKYLAEKWKSSNDNSGILDDDSLSTLFSLYRQMAIDDASLYARKQSRRQFESQRIGNAGISEEEKLRLRRLREEKRENRINRKNINAYVMMLLGEKEIIKASDMPLQDIEDHIRLIYIKLFSKSPLMKYQIERTNDRVHKGSYEYNDFLIRRKKNAV